jgi:5-methyltetrahydropteroyltriglutamate--homocysteine methyltransferase
MSQVNPPFRADHVGSLLRPPSLLKKREQYHQGEIPMEALRAAEDEAIKHAVKMQESVGLKSITDGEFRRTFFHLDFLEQVGGVTVSGAIAANPDAKQTKNGFTPPRLEVSGKLRHHKNIQVEDFRFLKSQVRQTPKVSIPSPTMVHFRGGRKAIDINSYPDMEQFFEDLAQVYREEIAALYDAGCRYIQMDDTNLAYLCDPKMRAGALERGDDPDELPRTYAALVNAAIRDRSDDLTVCVHLCRGNFRSTWFAEGSYEPVAEVLFNEMNVDGYFLEYDDERSGDFAPLRFVPEGKTIVVGLVTSKTGELEAQDVLIKRVHEAARYVPLDNMCLSPQCGFSSTVHGNELSQDAQWAKLELVVNTAREIWGD